jgi:hypothetical protein
VLCMISMHYFWHSFPFPSTIRSLDFPHPLAKVQCIVTQEILYFVNEFISH